MAELFASGRLVDLILLVVAAQALLVSSARHPWSDRLPRAPMLAHLASGTGLLLALRVGLSGGWWGWIGLCLIGALVGHVAFVCYMMRPLQNSDDPERHLRRSVK